MSTTLRRALVVLGCYALSGYGLLLSLLLAGASVGSASTLTLVGLPILLAWLCHLSMSWHWVCNRPSSALVRAAGTLAALLGLLLWPQVLQQPPRWALADTWSALAMGGAAHSALCAAGSVFAALAPAGAAPCAHGHGGALTQLLCTNGAHLLLFSQRCWVHSPGSALRVCSGAALRRCKGSA